MKQVSNTSDPYAFMGVLSGVLSRQIETVLTTNNHNNMTHPDDKLKQLHVEVPVSTHKELNALVENTHYKSKTHAVENAISYMKFKMQDEIAENSGNDQ